MFLCSMFGIRICKGKEKVAYMANALRTGHEVDPMGKVL